MKHNDAVYCELSPSIHPPFGFERVRISRTRSQEVQGGFVVDTEAQGLNFHQILHSSFQFQLTLLILCVLDGAYFDI